MKPSKLAILSKRAAPVADDEGKTVAIPLEKIRFDATQPRQEFHHPDGQVTDVAQLSLEELAASIEANGLIHAITVEPLGDGTYRVVVGERRTRAYLLLGKTTIQAKIRDDLRNPKTRLIYQVAENVNRSDLSDADMASSIRVLMNGSSEVEPMTQAQIAKELGKSEGWVSRYVKYGDEEQQRLWVQTGIADTVEKVYRLSTLPVAMQADIQRRVNLPNDDPQYLPKPLLRSVIDGYAQRSKSDKRAAAVQAESQSSVAQPTSLSASTTQQEQQEQQSHNAPSDSAAQTETETWTTLAGQGQKNAGKQVAAGSSHAGNNAAYTLTEEQRASILSKANVTPDTTVATAAQPPVSVRAPVASLQALLKKLTPEDLLALEKLQLSISLPGPLAARIASVLTGVMVEPSEVPAVVQNELVKLQ